MTPEHLAKLKEGREKARLAKNNNQENMNNKEEITIGKEQFNTLVNRLNELESNSKNRGIVNVSNKDAKSFATVGVLDGKIIMQLKGCYEKAEGADQRKVLFATAVLEDGTEKLIRYPDFMNGLAPDYENNKLEVRIEKRNVKEIITSSGHTKKRDMMTDKVMNQNVDLEVITTISSFDCVINEGAREGEKINLPETSMNLLK